MLGFVDVMMRVPPIMVIDEILKIGMGLPTRLYPDKVSATDAVTTTTTTPGTGHMDASTSSDTFSTIKSFFGMDKDETTAAGAAVVSAVTSSISNSSQEFLEKSIENASKSAHANGLLSNTFNTLIDELAHDGMLSDILSITTIKFVICLLGECNCVCLHCCSRWDIHRRLSQLLLFLLLLLRIDCTLNLGCHLQVSSVRPAFLCSGRDTW